MVIPMTFHSIRLLQQLLQLSNTYTPTVNPLLGHMDVCPDQFRVKEVYRVQTLLNIPVSHVLSWSILRLLCVCHHTCSQTEISHVTLWRQHEPLDCERLSLDSLFIRGVKVTIGTVRPVCRCKVSLIWSEKLQKNCGLIGCFFNFFVLRGSFLLL